MLMGTVLQTCVLFGMIYKTNWNKEVRAFQFTHLQLSEEDFVSYFLNWDVICHETQASIAEDRIRKWGGHIGTDDKQNNGGNKVEIWTSRLNRVQSLAKFNYEEDSHIQKYGSTGMPFSFQCRDQSSATIGSLFLHWRFWVIINLSTWSAWPMWMGREISGRGRHW